jgi:type IV secretory pathway VirB6-like protein
MSVRSLLFSLMLTLLLVGGFGSSAWAEARDGCDKLDGQCLSWTNNEGRGSILVESESCKIYLDACCDCSPFMSGSLEEIGTTAEANETLDVSGILQVVPRIFSATTCQVEWIVGEVMGSTWCIIKDAMIGPLNTLLLLYVVILGFGFTIGLIPMTIGEVVKNGIKMLMVWIFATNADYALGIMYRFYMYLLKDGIQIVLTSGADSESVGLGKGHILHNLDAMMSHVFMRNNETTIVGGVGAIGAALATAAVAPFGFILGPAVLAQGAMTMLVFFRTILTYMVAMVGMVMYMSMGPIFLCFALFKRTNEFFENWLRQIASFALQPVIIFAYLMMIEAYMTNFLDFIVIDDLTGCTDVQPNANQVAPAGGLFANMAAYVCRRNEGETGDMDAAITSLQQDWSGGMGDIGMMVTSLGGLALLNFATVKFLEMVPNLARQLTAMGGRAIKIGGGEQDPTFGAGVRAPGETMFNDMVKATARSAETAPMREGETMEQYVARMTSTAANAGMGSLFSRFGPSQIWESSWSNSWSGAGSTWGKAADEREAARTGNPNSGVESARTGAAADETAENPSGDGALTSGNEPN